MPLSSTYRPAVQAGRAALLCLACWWGSGTALEVHPDRLRQQAASRYGPQAAQRVDAWLRRLHDDAGLSERDKLTRVNDFWNASVAGGDDQLIWKQADYWATPLESLGRGVGDCEDYVIGKYFSLVALGVPADRLRFIYVKARIGGPGSSQQIAHMVLGYYTTPNAVPLVLDSLLGTILPATERRDLIPVFSFNTDGIYVDGKQAAPVDRIGRWRELLLRMQREGLTP